jgi:hypothetical protein
MLARDALMAMFIAARGEQVTFVTLLDNRVAPKPDGSDQEWLRPFATSHSLFHPLIPPLGCVRSAALTLRDFRLLLFDVQGLIRWFQRLALSLPEAQRATAATTEVLETRLKHWRDELGRSHQTLEFMVGTEEANRLCGAPDNRFDAELGALAREWGGFEPVRPGVREAAARLAELRQAPYAAIAAASLFWAIGGAESAASILSRWIEANEPLAPPASARDTTALRLEAAVRTWLRVRAILELDNRLPGDLIDSGNAELARLLATIPVELRAFLPDAESWLTRTDACKPQPLPANAKEALFREVEQQFYASLIAARLRGFRAQAAIHRLQPLHEWQTPAVNDAMLAEARTLAAVQPRCFPTMPGLQARRDNFQGSAHLFHAEIARALLEGRLRAGAGLGTRDEALLTDARDAYDRALRLLRSQALADLAPQPAPAKAETIDLFNPHPREVALLGGPQVLEEVRMAERGLAWLEELRRRQ